MEKRWGGGALGRTAISLGRPLTRDLHLKRRLASWDPSSSLASSIGPGRRGIRLCEIRPRFV
jgi:hypothetical protein